MANELLTKKEVSKQFPDVPNKGRWYELMDFAVGKGNNFGFYGFVDGKHVILESGYNRIYDAGEAAREWKERIL